VPPTLAHINWTEYWPFALLGLLAVLYLATLPLVRGRERKIRALAQANQFTPIKKPQADMKAAKTLHRGHASFNLAHEYIAPSGFTIRFFEHAYAVHLPPASVGTAQTVIAFKIPGQEQPSFRLAPINVVDRIGAKLGMANIVPYESTTFAQRYALRGEIPDAIQVLFRPEVVRCLEAVPPGEEWTVESAGEWMIFFQPGKLFEAEELGEEIADAGAWLNLFYGREYYGPDNCGVQSNLRWLS
jgi:hypothetical protein